MDFLGNPSEELGLDYHTFAEIPQDDGSVVVRFVLSKHPNPEQIALIEKYDNLKLVKDGATYRYALEQKYSVLYQNLSAEGKEEVATEDFPEDEEILALSQLDQELGLDGPVSPEEELSKFAMVTNAISMANNLALYYKQLELEDSNNSEIYNKLASEIVDQVNKLQGIINYNENPGI